MKNATRVMFTTFGALSLGFLAAGCDSTPDSGAPDASAVTVPSGGGGGAGATNQSYEEKMKAQYQQNNQDLYKSKGYRKK